MKEDYSIIYDLFINNNKYSKQTEQIERELLKLDIKAKINKLSLLNSLQAITKENVQQKIKTLIVVGDDTTFTNILDIVVPSTIVLGFIPIGNNNKISKMFGINDYMEACHIISQRIIKKINVGKINNFYFLENVTINPEKKPFTLSCDDDSFKINFQNNFQLIQIKNKLGINETNNNKIILEIVPNKTNQFFSLNKTHYLNTKIPLKKIIIKSEESIPLLIDSTKIIKTPVIIQASPEKLNLIVNRHNVED